MTDRRAPIDTTKLPPELFLAEALFGGRGTEGAILNQEAQGQASFVNSTTLPTRLNDYGDSDSRAILEAAGVKFLEAVPGDPLFQYVELPVGWKKVGTDHSMWSKLVDDQGRERASIFYKAASYDRDAFMSAVTVIDGSNAKGSEGE